MRFEELKNKGLLGTPDDYISSGMIYECIMGSYSYGIATEKSDFDIYGICIPPKEHIFPHLSGELFGLDNKGKYFELFEKHHVQEKRDAANMLLEHEKENNLKEYDFAIYPIVKFFKLCLENNPNIIDSIFVPDSCVTYETKIWKKIKEHRNKFLSKKAWPKFKGYAYAQIRKMKTSDNLDGKKPSRADMINEFGYDVKFASHCVRLLLEIEQILLEENLSLDANKDTLLSIRKGEVSKDEILVFFAMKEAELTEVFEKSNLREEPDFYFFKNLLLECLEEFYGSIDNCINWGKWKI